MTINLNGAAFLQTTQQSVGTTGNRSGGLQQRAGNGSDDTFAGLMAKLQNPDNAARAKASVARQDISNPVQEFRDYMAKSPAEKIKEKVLNELGLTGEAYEALPPEEKAKIDDMIAARLKESIELNTQAKLQEQQAGKAGEHSV